MTNYLAQRIILFVFFIKGCVGPPDYNDGLLENTPAVINENDYFSLSILGDNYTENKEWDLLISATPTATLLTTLIIKDLNSPVSDSSFLLLINDLGDTSMHVLIINELILTSLDSINQIGVPSKVVFKGDNFNGRLEYQMIIN